MASRVGYRGFTRQIYNLSSILWQTTIVNSQKTHRCMSTFQFFHETRENLFHQVVDRSKYLSHVEQTQRRDMFNSLYWPVYNYILEQRESITKSPGRGEGKPLFVGISAPQGCGKTTLTTVLEEMFSYAGFHAVSISLDDFYLRGKEQDELAMRNSSNSLLHYRGNGKILAVLFRQINASHRLHRMRSGNA